MAKESSTKPTRVEFHFIKSNDFRVVHCDGVWGGATPRGLISMNFYSERVTIPQKVTYTVSESSLIGSEIKRESKEGFIREVDCAVMLDLNTAKSLIVWLQEHINAIEKHPSQKQRHG